MSSAGLILVCVIAAIQLVNILIVYDLWRSSKRYHSALSIGIFFLMFLRRITTLIILLNSPFSLTGIVILDHIVLPLLTTLSCYILVNTPKYKVVGQHHHG